MTNQKPCREGCAWGPDGKLLFHSTACPNTNAPKPPEAPKVEIIDLMGALKRSLNQHPNAKPAPAPEPKGSEEPILPVTELEAEKSTSKILRNLLVKAEAERDEARATKDMHKERQEEAWAEVTALRAEVERLKPYEGLWDKHQAIRLNLQKETWAAQAAARDLESERDALRASLASAREEIAKLRDEANEDFATQLFRAERAESRVKRLAGIMEARGIHEECGGVKSGTGVVLCNCAILARAKEGEKR